MARLNLTLDDDTFSHLKKHARQQSRPVAGLARDLVRESIARLESRQRQRKLAADYRAGRKDARALLDDMETAQLDLLDDDEA